MTDEVIAPCRFEVFDYNNQPQFLNLNPWESLREQHDALVANGILIPEVNQDNKTHYVCAGAPREEIPPARALLVIAEEGL